MIRILGRASSINVRKALWSAAEAGLAFRHEPEWDDGASLRDPAFLALNPNAQIPVLVHEGGALWESNTICRYLAARAGREDLLPAAPAARAEVEKWMDWQATELNTAWRPAYMALVRRRPGYWDDPAVVQASVAQWNRLMSMLDARLQQTGAYVCGDTFTLADVVLGLSLQRWLHTPIERPALPALHEYRERLLARPAAQAWSFPDLS